MIADHISTLILMVELSNNQTDRCKKCLFFVTDSQEKNYHFLQNVVIFCYKQTDTHLRWRHI